MRLVLFVFYLTTLWNKLEGGFINYPSIGGTAILQDSYSIPPYTASAAAVETIGYAPATTGVIEKKIYVHVPQQDNTYKYGPPPAPPRKHYKIIFVKAPSPPSQAPVQPEIEEKTLVYVLVKKPEPPIVNEVQNNVKSSKPEVYFINYKTQKSNVGTQSQSGLLSSGGRGSEVFATSLSSSDNGGLSGSSDSSSTVIGGGGGSADYLGGQFGGGAGSLLGQITDANPIGFDDLGSSSQTSDINGLGRGGQNNAPSTYGVPESSLPPLSSYLPPNFIK